LRKKWVTNHAALLTGAVRDSCARPRKTPKNVPIAIASALIAMLKAKPLASSGVHFQTVSTIDGAPDGACACA